MSVLEGEKKFICEEQVQAGSIITEAGQKIIARGINFSLERALKIHAWNLNGAYSLGVGSYVDGILTSPYNYSIESISIYQRKDGVSGNTQIEIDYIDVNGVNQGNIVNVITLPSGKGDLFHYMYLPQKDIELVNAGEIAKPAFSKTQFSAGEAIILKVNTAQVSASDLHITIHYLEEN